jgi:predicted nucleic acid-binding protein
MIYSDTSFLVSLYLNDQNGETAIRFVEKRGGPILYTPLVRIEMANALRLWQFRKILTESQIRAVFLNISDDLANGFLQETPVVWSDLLPLAERLSVQFTPKTGSRTLDILHVAAAIVLDVNDFLSFNKKQRLLAKKADLSVFPKKPVSNG